MLKIKFKINAIVQNKMHRIAPKDNLYEPNSTSSRAILLRLSFTKEYYRAFSSASDLPCFPALQKL